MSGHESLIEAPETCQVLVVRGGNRWSKREPCGKAAKEDGLCGIHLAARNRREANDAKRREKWDRSKALEAEADKLCAALGARVEPYYNSILHDYDGRFVVDGDWLWAQVTG